MAYKDPEQERQRRREYRERNREQINEYKRQWRAANPDLARAQRRRFAEKNRAAIRQRKQAFRDANRERINEEARQYGEQNRQKRREIDRKSRQRNLNARQFKDMIRFHGPTFAAVFAQMWQSQDGRCYLCRMELDAANTHVDHDHRCCPPDASCSTCRRGLACRGCNAAIGFAGDDPERLRLMAANLEAALAAVTARMAERPEQLALL